MVGKTLLSLISWSHGRRGRHARGAQRFWELFNSLQVERVEELEGEDDLVQLRLTVAAREDPRASRDREVRVLVCDVWPLNGDVAVVAEVERVQGFVAITVLLVAVRDQRAETRRDSQPSLQ